MPQGKALREALNQQFKEQEGAILESLDESQIRMIDPNQLKVDMCMNQAIRAEQNKLLDNDYLVELLEKYGLLIVKESEDDL